MSAPALPDRPAGSAARWLPAELRSELRERGQGRVILAHLNYKLGIEGKRLELALTKESGWGFVAELAFGPLSYSLVGGLVGAVARARKSAIRVITEAEFRGAQGGDGAVAIYHRLAERVNPDRVRDGMAHLMRATRSGVKERSKSLPPHASSKMALLSILGSGADQHAQGVLETVIPQLDDDALILLVEAYDVQHHSRETYGSAIDDMLARYEAQGIADIGEESAPGAAGGRNAEPALQQRTEAVRFRYRGRERVAVVDRVLPTGGEAPAVTLESLRLCQWSHWIDEDLSGAAAGVQEGRLGSALTLDVEGNEIPPTWLPMVSTWIATVQR
jgi:hypothetical protein